VAAIAKVDQQSQHQPGEEGHPGHHSQAHHQQYAKDDSQKREERTQRSTKAARPLRLAIAQDEYRDGDQDKGEKGADVGEVGDSADVQQSGGNADHKSGDPGGDSRGAEAWMNAAENGGQQAVPGHGEPDACLAELKDQDGGDHAQDGADEDKEAHPLQVSCAGQQGEPLEGVDHRGGVAHHRLPGHNAAENDGYRAVEHGASHQCGQNANGKVALRILAFLGRRRDRIKADVGEEDDGAAGQHAGPAVGHEGMPVVRLDKAGPGKDKDQNGGHLDQHHDVVGAGRLANATHQEYRQEHHDQEGGNVKAKVPAGFVEIVAGKILKTGGQVGRGDPLDRQVDAEPVKEVDQVSGEGNADSHVAEGVFQNQIPADDPGH